MSYIHLQSLPAGKNTDTKGSSESTYSNYTAKSLLHLHPRFETFQDHTVYLTSLLPPTGSSSVAPACLTGPFLLCTMFQLHWLSLCSSKWLTLTSGPLHLLSHSLGTLCYHTSLLLLPSHHSHLCLKVASTQPLSLSCITTCNLLVYPLTKM